MKPSFKLDAGLVSLCAAALAMAAIVVAPVVLSSGELYWHIAAGRWMIDNQAVLRIDPFSYTFAGQPWQTQEWLSEIVVALAYVGAGWSGVIALTAGLAALSAGLLAWFLSRWLNSLTLVTVLGLSFGCAAGAGLATPHLLALPVAIAWIAGLVNARSEQRGPSLFLVVLMPIWANLSATFVLGLAILLVLGLETVLQSSKHRVAVLRDWWLMIAGALLIGLATPYGAQGLMRTVRELILTDMTTVRSVWPALVAIPVLAVLVWRPQRVPLLRLAVLTALLVLALYNPGAQLVFAAALPLLLAAPLSFGENDFNRRMSIKTGIITVIVLVGVLAARIALPAARAEDSTTPETAFAKVPQALLHAPVLNDKAFGGYLIFRDVRPFIDDRHSYNREFRARYAKIASSDRRELDKALLKYHVRWTIWTPGSPAATAMDNTPGWHRLYADRWAVIHVRNDH